MANVPFVFTRIETEMMHIFLMGIHVRPLSPCFIISTSSVEN